MAGVKLKGGLKISEYSVVGQLKNEPQGCNYSLGSASQTLACRQKNHLGRVSKMPVGRDSLGHMPRRLIQGVGIGGRGKYTSPAEY